MYPAGTKSKKNLGVIELFCGLNFLCCLKCKTNLRTTNTKSNSQSFYRESTSIVNKWKSYVPGDTLRWVELEYY